jgi:hypothetical protein
MTLASGCFSHPFLSQFQSLQSLTDYSDTKLFQQTCPSMPIGLKAHKKQGVKRVKKHLPIL